MTQAGASQHFLSVLPLGGSSAPPQVVCEWRTEDVTAQAKLRVSVWRGPNKMASVVLGLSP